MLHIIQSSPVPSRPSCMQDCTAKCLPVWRWRCIWAALRQADGHHCLACSPGHTLWSATLSCCTAPTECSCGSLNCTCGTECASSTATAVPRALPQQDCRAGTTGTSGCMYVTLVHVIWRHHASAGCAERSQHLAYIRHTEPFGCNGRRARYSYASPPGESSRCYC